MSARSKGDIDQATKNLKKFQWYRDTWKVLDKYFSQPRILAHNQLNSYNDFVDNIIPSLIKNHNPIVVGHDWDPIAEKFRIRYEVEFAGQPYMSRPQINEGSGSIQNLYPNEARLRGLSYSAYMYLDVTHRFYENDVLQDQKTETQIPFKFPCMLHSEYCYLQQSNAESLRQMGECPYDLGGYFIINGSEKVIISQERPVDNKVLCFRQKTGGSAKFDEVVEIRSTIDQRFYPVRNNWISLTLPKEGEADQYLRISFPYLTNSTPIPLMTVFRAIGITTDREILEMILGSDVNREGISDDIVSLILPSFEELVDVTDEPVGPDGRVRRSRTRVKKKITTQSDALLYISRHISMNMEYLDNKLPPKLSEEEKVKAREVAKKQYVLDILRRDLLPHMGHDFRRKAIFLGHMCWIMIACKLGLRSYDVRDHYSNKRLDLAGPLLKKLFQGSFGRLIKEIKREVNRTLEDSSKGLLHPGLRKVIQNCNMEAPIKKALSTGDFTPSKNANLFSSASMGVAQVLQRLSYIAYLSNIRRIATPLEKAGGKITEPRKLDPTQYGYVCPNETPEGQQVGIVKNLALTTTITISSSTLSIKTALKKLKDKDGNLAITPLDETDPRHIYYQVKVFLNGEWLGCSSDPHRIYLMVKKFKRNGTFSPYIGVYWNFGQRELHIRTDGGRYTRPLYVVEKFGDVWVPKIALEWDRAQKMNFKELVRNGYIEYIDPEECENSMIAMTSDLLAKNSDNLQEFYTYTHMELHPSMCQGVVSQMIPFSDHNQSPRNCYQSSMGKQALGLYATNFNQRMDTMAHVLCYPQKPLVTTRTTRYANLERLPHGQQCIVAVASYTGYNQEDSVLMNKSAVDRGKFNSIYFKSYVSEMNPHKSSTAEEERFGRPDTTRTQGIKHGEDAYRHLDDDGFAKLGSFVRTNDVLIGKTVKMKDEIKSITGRRITHSDISVQVKPGDFGYVDKRIPSMGSVKNLNADNNPFCKLRIAQLRKPVIGDKVASRMAQKGTVGLLLAEEDMPFTDSGMVPDIVMNPHALPSRMTVGQMLECIFGKAACLDCEIKDATPFTHFDQSEIHDILKKYGYEENGEEVMYNGFTGEMMKTTIFVGPVYYQRLKHMVKDKIHARATGRVNNLTKQSVEGRNQGGGLRLGEMERDVFISHGMSAYLKERFWDSADGFRVFIGKEAETMVVGNPDKDLYIYDSKMLNPEDVSEVQMPYAMKLLIHEFTSMGIDFRMATADDD